MSSIHIVREYDRPVPVVWQAVTDPDLVPLWTSTGRGGRPEGFEPVVGTRFRFVGRPVPGWDGIVRCEVLEVDAPHRLRYSWRGGADETPSEVAYGLAETPTGTRFSYDHTGLGLVMAMLLGRVRRTMLTRGLPAVLARLDAEGHLTGP